MFCPQKISSLSNLNQHIETVHKENQFDLENEGSNEHNFKIEMDSSIPNREFWVRKLQVKHPNVSINSFSQDLTDAAKDTLIEILELDSDTTVTLCHVQLKKALLLLKNRESYGI